MCYNGTQNTDMSQVQEGSEIQQQQQNLTHLFYLIFFSDKLSVFADYSGI